MIYTIALISLILMMAAFYFFYTELELAKKRVTILRKEVNEMLFELGGVFYDMFAAQAKQAKKKPKAKAKKKK